MEYTKLPKIEKKKLIMAEMAIGANVDLLAEKYDVNPMTIGSWRRKARLEQEDIVSTTKVDPVVLDAIVLEIKDKAAKSDLTDEELTRVETQLDVAITGVKGLQVLEGKFRDTMIRLLRVANHKIDDEMKLSDWSLMVTKLGELHKTLFSSGDTTNINMLQQNNGGSSTKVEKFKAGYRS